jgi:hypothetical protein
MRGDLFFVATAKNKRKENKINALFVFLCFISIFAL